MIRKILGKTIRGLYRFTLIGMSKGPHITRYQMYKHLESFSEPRSHDLKVLSISHSEPLAQVLGFSAENITDASYPEINVLDLPYEDESFDAVISDQVLEHIEGDPQQAINEAYRVLKPNGLSLHATCFITPLHRFPGDYWRFTPDALAWLTKPHGEVLDVGGWGNPYVWPFAALGLRFEPIPNTRWHPAHWLATYNHPEWPIVTWVLSKKRG